MTTLLERSPCGGPLLHFVRVFGKPENPRFDVAAAVRSFLMTRGFREERGTTPLKFRRSSHLATILAFDPSRWRVDLQLDPAMRTVQMFVHTDGQVVTPRERRYFETFFDELLAVMAPELSPQVTALSLWGDQALSRRAARAALNENVAVTFGFFLSFPTLIVLLHAAVSVPMLGAICWAFVGSLAIAYACLFSAKNRPARGSGVTRAPSRPARSVGRGAGST